MVTPSNVNPKGYYEKVDKKDLEYDSPYVEISGDGFQYESANTSIYEPRGSVNSFLDEAEIISPSGDQSICNANQRMRKKLNSFFMNPLEKWQKRNRFPWKLCVQLIKIIIATLQMSLFGHHSFAYMKQHLDMTTTLSRILLKDWAADVSVYPPSFGPYSVYTIPEFYDHIDTVVKQYTTIGTLAIGTYGYDSPSNVLPPIDFCIKEYVGQVFPSNSSIEIDDLPKESCLTIPPLYPGGDPAWSNFSMLSYFKETNFTLNFRTLIHAQLHLRLKTVFIKALNKLDFPECYKLIMKVMYDNSEHDGQLLISLLIKSNKINCHMNTHIGDQGENLYYILRQVLNGLVIVFCFLSGILCLRSLYSGYKLSRETISFFKRYYQKEIPAWEQLDFIDFWYVNIVISDVMLVFGSLIKLQIEEQTSEGTEYAKCSILLGVGNLLIWIGILRYLGFFPKYNMLILTLKRALPNVLRFLICAIMLFVGSCFCGWIVLAPYHIKFRTLSRTAECLFSIMNGDDMFATFALLDTNLDLIWYFSRIFLYTFLLVFVYIVVSLFISVIMDTFETIKHIYVYGAPPNSAVEVFLAADTSDDLPDVPSVSSTPVNEKKDVLGCCKRFWNCLRFPSQRF